MIDFRIMAYPGTGGNYFSRFYMKNTNGYNSFKNEYFYKMTTRHFDYFNKRSFENKEYYKNKNCKFIMINIEDDIDINYFRILSMLKTYFFHGLSLSENGKIIIENQHDMNPRKTNHIFRNETVNLIEYENYKKIYKKFDIPYDSQIALDFYFLEKPIEKRFIEFFKESFFLLKELEDKDGRWIEKKYNEDVLKNLTIKSEVVNYKKLIIDNEPQGHYLDQFMEQHKEYHKKNIEFYKRYEHLIPIEYRIDINSLIKE